MLNKALAFVEFGSEQLVEGWRIGCVVYGINWSADLYSGRPAGKVDAEPVVENGGEQSNRLIKAATSTSRLMTLGT